MRRWPLRRHPSFAAAAASAFCLFLAGCARAPAFNVLGSFFPGWIACIVFGILITVLVHLLLQRAGIERNLKALPVLYLCSALIFGSILWLLVFE